MLGYLKRLVTTGAAYQFGDILAKGLALLTLPLYTRHLDTKAYGAAETLLTAVILVSILLRVGVGEALRKPEIELRRGIVVVDLVGRVARAGQGWRIGGQP